MRNQTVGQTTIGEPQWCDEISRLLNEYWADGYFALWYLFLKSETLTRAERCVG